MCTLTFIPLHNSTFITHSRDEKSARSRAISPQVTRVNGTELLFPKDGEAGGSWVSVNEHGDAAVLLNGGFVKHVPTPPYRRSRGLCFLDIAAADDLHAAYTAIDLDGIEPFTVILYTRDRQLWECRWDGHTKHIKQLDAALPHIWSSVTLYDETITTKRKAWFDQWLRKIISPSLQEIIDFHLSGGEGDQQNDFRMNRGNVLLTVSVTAMQLLRDKGVMKYLDLQDNMVYNKEIKFLNSVAGDDQSPSYISSLYREH